MVTLVLNTVILYVDHCVALRNYEEKSRLQETPNLLTDADSSTNIFVSAGVNKRG